MKVEEFEKKIKQKLKVSRSNVSALENDWMDQRYFEVFLRTIEGICRPNIKKYLIIPLIKTPLHEISDNVIN